MEKETNTGGEEQQQQAPPAIDAKEFEALKTQLAEKDAAAKFWYEKATAAATERAKPAAKDVETEEADEDLLALITEKGSKGFEKFLAKRGFVRADEVDRRVNLKANQLSREAQLAQSYPDLKDQDSEFFKATAQAYGTLKKQGIADDLAMEMAAEKTELAFIRSGKIDLPAAKKQREDEARRTRARAQSGESGGRPSEAADDDTLTSEQKRICSAMGITEDAYLKRAKAGVVSTAGRKANQ